MFFFFFWSMVSASPTPKAKLVYLGGERDTRRRLGKWVREGKKVSKGSIIKASTTESETAPWKKYENETIHFRIIRLWHADSQESQAGACSKVVIILNHFPLALSMARMSFSGWGWGGGNPSVIDADTGTYP